MNRFTIALGVLSISLLLALGSLRQATPSSTSPYPVGIIAPLSGDYASYGIEIQRGVQLAKDTLESEGIKLKTIFEDACIPSKGVAAAKKLIQIDRISALVGNYCIASMVPNTEIFERNNILAFQSSVVPNSLLNKRNIISTYPSIAEEATKLAEHAYTSIGSRAVAILYLQTPWGEEFRTAFANEFKRLGGRITAEEGNPIGVNEFRTELTKIKASKPDTLFFVHVGPTMGNALKQARILGLRQTALGPDESEQIEVIQIGQQAAEGLTIIVPEATVSSKNSENFKRMYKDKYKTSSTLLAAHAFDATLIAARAIKKCNNDKSCISSQVRATPQFTGASGNFSISGDGSTERQYVIKKVINGKFEAI